MLRFSSDGDKVQVSVRPPLVYVVHYYESVRRPEPFLPYSVHVSTNALCLALPGIPNVRERERERERERDRERERGNHRRNFYSGDQTKR
jgi:hypothetical protein